MTKAKHLITQHINIINSEALRKQVSNDKCGWPLIVPLRDEDVEFGFMDIPAPIGFVPPRNKDTGKELPYCCEGHMQIFNVVQEFYDKFPNCCEHHKKLNTAKWFNKNKYSNVATKVVNQGAYTFYHIEQHIENNDWYKEITDYILLNVRSFGQLPKGYGNSVGLQYYYSHLTNVLEQNREGIDIEKSKKLLAFIKDLRYPSVNDTARQVDIREIAITYQNWLQIFPFDIEPFCKLKDKFARSLPLIDGKVEFNKYTGTYSGTPMTRSRLLELLLEKTNELLIAVDTYELLSSGQIKDTQKHQLEYLNREHKLRQKALLNGLNRNELVYAQLISSWLRNEREYIKEAVPLFTPTMTTEDTTRSEQIKTNLSELGFFQLDKVQRLSDIGQQKLLELITINDLPYVIALLNCLGFPDYLMQEHFTTKAELNKKLSACLLLKDKKGRSVGGNLSSFSPNSSDRPRYTAYKHKENAEKDYLDLK